MGKSFFFLFIVCPLYVLGACIDLVSSVQLVSGADCAGALDVIDGLQNLLVNSHFQLNFVPFFKCYLPLIS